MRILCVVPVYFPAFQYGGPIASVHNLNKALVEKGIEVTVYATNAGLKGKVSTNQEINIDGVKVSYFDFFKIFEFLGPTGWQFSRSMTVALKKHLKEFDLIYLSAIWNYPTAIAAHYCRKYKKPYIVSVRGTLYPFTIRKKAWKKWLYYKLITRNDLEMASAIHYTTQDELEKCHSSLGLKNRAFVAPNIIDLAEYADLPPGSQFRNRYQIPQDKKIILFLGRIHWIKGLDTLIPAFAEVIKKEPLAVLVLAGGDDGYKKTATELIKKRNLGEYVIFTGMLSGEEKTAALKDSDVFVLPSYSENFGMAVVEAMAFGLPVIITRNIGIASDVILAKAGLVVEKEEKELSEAILKILANPDLAKEMGQRGRRLVETEFSGSAVADKFIEVCKEIT